MRMTLRITLFLAVNGCLFAQLTLPGGYKTLSPARRLRAATRAGDYLGRALNEKGTFAYEISLQSGGPTERYVWRDHAMAVLTLIRLYEYGNNPAYLKAAQAAAKPLVAKLQTITFDSKEYTAFVDEARLDGESRKVVKTVDCACVAAALAELDRVTKKQDHHDSLKSMCAYLELAVSEYGDVKPVLLLDANQARNAFLNLQSNTVQSKMLFALATVNASVPSDAIKSSLHRLLIPCAYRWKAAVETPQTKPFDHWGLIGLAKCIESIDDDVMKKGFDGYLKHVDEAAKAVEKELKTDITRSRRKTLSNSLIGIEATRQVVKRAGAMTKKSLETLAFNYCQTELLSLIHKENDPNRGTFDTRLRTAGRLLPTAQRVEGISAIATMVMRKKESPKKADILNWSKNVDLARRYVLSRQITPELSKQYNAEIDVTGAFAVKSVCIMPCYHAINAFIGW